MMAALDGDFAMSEEVVAGTAAGETKPTVRDSGEAPGSPRSIEWKQLRELSKRNFYFFARSVLNRPFLQPSPHIKVCKFLQDNMHGDHVIVLPRGFLKTTLCSVCYPLWRAVKNPNLCILIASNTKDNARYVVSHIRQMVEQNEMFRWLFPEVLPQDRFTPWTDSRACLNRTIGAKESTFEAVGVTSAVVGRHYDIIIADDLVFGTVDKQTNQMYLPLQEDIERAKRWLQQSRPLFNDPDNRLLLSVGTRWAPDDVQSYMMERAENVLDIPAIDDDGNTVYNRYPHEVLAQIKRDVGPAFFATQYQNKPMSETEILFKDEWFRYYDTAPDDLLIVATVDPASRDKRDNDYTAIVVVGWDRYTDNYYVLDVTNARMTPSETIDKIYQLQDLFKINLWGIEVVSYQLALKDFLIRDAAQRQKPLPPIKEIKPLKKVRKIQRILGMQPRFARNMFSPIKSGIFIREEQRALVDQLRTFPALRHDDVIDALAYVPQVLPKSVDKRQEERNNNPNLFDNIIRRMSRKGQSKYRDFIR